MTQPLAQHSPLPAAGRGGLCPAEERDAGSTAAFGTTTHPLLLTKATEESSYRDEARLALSARNLLWHSEDWIKHPAMQFSRYTSVGLNFPVLFEMLMGIPVIYNKGTDKKGQE